jgi:hypothetical protein
MDLLTLVIILVCVGVLWGLVGKFGSAVGMDARAITVVQWVIVVVTIVWLLNMFGVFNAVRQVTVPTVK